MVHVCGNAEIAAHTNRCNSAGGSLAGMNSLNKAPFQLPIHQSWNFHRIYSPTHFKGHICFLWIRKQMGKAFQTS